jgi:hypothetical protein
MIVTKAGRLVATNLLSLVLVLLVLGAGFLAGWMVGEHVTIDRYAESTKVCRELRS